VLEKPPIHGIVQAKIFKMSSVNVEIGKKLVNNSIDGNKVTSDVHLLLKVIATATHNTITEGTHARVLAGGGATNTKNGSSVSRLPMMPRPFTAY